MDSGELVPRVGSGVIVHPAAEGIHPHAYPEGRSPDKSNCSSQFCPVDISVLFGQVEEDIPWLLEGYLAPGLWTLLAGAPKLGKTTFAYDALVSIATGQPFLGQDVPQKNVLILGLEEHPRDMTARLRVSCQDNLSGRIKVQTSPLPYDVSVRQELLLYIKQEDIGLVVVDTLPTWWSLDDENDAGKVNKAGKPLLQLIRDSGAAWLCLAHTRKGGGENGEAIRGSTALPALVDIAITMTGVSETKRKLDSISRYEETPRSLIVELTEHGYIGIGTPAQISINAKAEKLWGVLEEVKGHTNKQLLERTGLKKQALSKAIQALGEKVRITGEGVRSAPHVYYRNSIHPAPNSVGEGVDELQMASAAAANPTSA